MPASGSPPNRPVDAAFGPAPGQVSTRLQLYRLR